MIGLKRGIVVLEEYSIEWEINAKKIISELREIFGDKAVDIQHIGSTAIRNLKAKPIIDILVGVKDFQDVFKIMKSLESRGFIHKRANDNKNHMFFSCGDFKNDIRTHHIHVDIYGGDEWNDYIKFRNKLRSNKDLRMKYEQLKIDLCEQFPNDRENYTEMKGAFIREVLDT
ncbi:GrpB family protein [Clostridium sp. WILCCON 0269]|uniref:GrpB family protein n=1 Tax=Candidatus Clostridium eludens TaxID=3381663 RepID=A0ABW8SK31_9CLOT